MAAVGFLPYLSAIFAPLKRGEIGPDQSCDIARYLSSAARRQEDRVESDVFWIVYIIKMAIVARD